MADRFYQLLGERIRRFRTLADLTLEQLAERADLDSQYVGFIERGQGKPSLDALQRLAAALSVKVSDLLQFEQEDRQEEKIYLARQTAQLLESRSPEEIHAIRKLIKQVIDLLPTRRRRRPLARR